MIKSLRTPGLRHRLVLAFALMALLVSTVFAASTYLLARGYLLAQRERVVRHQAFADTAFVQRRLESAGADVSAVLTAAGTPPGHTIILRWRGQWYASALDQGQDALPADVKSKTAAQQAVSQRFRSAEGPALAVGVPMPAIEAEFYEIAPLKELDGILRLLSGILIGGALLATAAGAFLGRWASRSVVTPLNRVASTAASIAGGDLDTRLPATDDPELATIVGSFNSMVDTLQQRINRDARLAADVSHELRSPLTTLVGSVDLLNARRDELPERSRRALDLVTADLQRFRRLLDDLLELARADAGLDSRPTEQVELGGLLRQVLSEVEHDPSVLTMPGGVVVLADKSRLSRLFRNLFENAERHGGGLTAVSVARAETEVLVFVDDSGSGIPGPQRDRVFERFATGPTKRGSSSGTGLGLALVAETATVHGGSVWCTNSPDDGARFVVRLPVAEVDR
ncbi:HAMP domain-containing sensor histidine kinase [Kribbella sp. CA-293567]|uniref:HAMP domain-containing sensor histidine kinase n=1 Tax=Kribbella sp. CA-293567 TaxID=3002436 RepID=UPI0022DD1577|nr:HAMP domain-containing sensor histidine kinase [Kribbella sp. CA-293567]WBQ02079.1 HAMP domain-containing sensor histidine kinase [Kribbella sp. CA-293567]